MWVGPQHHFTTPPCSLPPVLPLQEACVCLCARRINKWLQAWHAFMKRREEGRDVARGARAARLEGRVASQRAGKSWLKGHWGSVPRTETYKTRTLLTATDADAATGRPWAIAPAF